MRDRMNDTEWNIGDLVETIAGVRGDTPMVVTDQRTLSWSDVDRRTNALARHLVDAGLVQGDRVAVCARNAPAVLETYLACAKAALVPFNVNFRYGVDEIVYLLDNADARAVVAHAEFAPVVAAAAARVGGIAVDLEVDSSYEAVVEAGASAPFVPPWGRSPDDVMFQYTGGTTGMPKAVMWRQGDLVTLLAGSDAPPGHDRSGATPDIADRLAREPRRSCAIAPLIHGTGLLSQLANFFTGGTSVILPARSFVPADVWAAVDRHRINVVVIVGDPFARPMLEVLEAEPSRFDLRSLQMITSSGAMFSRPVKEGLLRELPWIALLDAFGSSEASGLGVSMSTAENLDDTAVFRPGRHVAIIDDRGAVLDPVPGAIGRIAVRGPVPIGYHKDSAKSAATYPEIDGVRYSVPGDIVEVAADGEMVLLGRGSAVINSGGEKIFPEEIEELLKEHPDVVDAAVVGVPDERYGSAVCAIVQGRPDMVVGADALREHVRSRAAGFKTPRHVVFVADLERHPNGKLDRTTLTRRALAELGRVVP